MGHNACGSDISENGINHTQKWLESNSLMANLKVADMTDIPFSGLNFHGVLSWDALHHNTISNINKAVAMYIKDFMKVGGSWHHCLIQNQVV